MWVRAGLCGFVCVCARVRACARACVHMCTHARAVTGQAGRTARAGQARCTHLREKVQWALLDDALNNGSCGSGGGDTKRDELVFIRAVNLRRAPRYGGWDRGGGGAQQCLRACGEFVFN